MFLEVFVTEILVGLLPLASCYCFYCFYCYYSYYHHPR